MRFGSHVKPYNLVNKITYVVNKSQFGDVGPKTAFDNSGYSILRKSWAYIIRNNTPRSLHITLKIRTLVVRRYVKIKISPIIFNFRLFC